MKALLLWAALCGAARAEAPVLRLSLERAESAALAHSLELKAAAEESAAAREGAEAEFSALLPRFLLTASYQYQSELPRFAAAAGAPVVEFGDHRTTFLGPSVSWTLWDQGSLYKTWRSRQAFALSQEERRRLSSSQAVLGARLAYIQVQLALERLRLLGESVAVASAQFGDIEKRLKAGRVSRMESLSSHQVELQRRKDFLLAQAGLGAALRELLQLMGEAGGLELARTVDVRIPKSALAGFAEPTLRVELDPLSNTPAALAAAERAGLDPSHPAVLAYARAAESARLSAQAVSAGRWPRVQGQAYIARQYPNGPVRETITQKTAGVSASVPLFEGGRSSSLAAAERHRAEAAGRRSELAAEQLARDWEKAAIQLASLRDQEALDRTAIRESEELARLTYSAYEGGRTTFLEVQSYDLRALETKVQAAQTQAQVLVQLATLAYIAR